MLEDDREVQLWTGTMKAVTLWHGCSKIPERNGANNKVCKWEWWNKM